MDRHIDHPVDIPECVRVGLVPYTPVSSQLYTYVGSCKDHKGVNLVVFTTSLWGFPFSIGLRDALGYFSTVYVWTGSV